MGLLDDAIREHLELKRRGGAEPVEIARVQLEALEPEDPYAPTMIGGEEQPPVEQDSGQASVETHYEIEPPEVPEPELSKAHDLAEMLAEHPASAPLDPELEIALDPEPQVDDVSSWTGQETVEIDMQAVLAEDVEIEAVTNERPGAPHIIDRSKADKAPRFASAADHNPMLYSHQEEPLEWEDQPEGPTQVPQQEHVSFE